MSSLPPIKSSNVAYSSGGIAQFPIWFGTKGPNGERVCARGFWLFFVGTATVATAAWEGEDVPRIFGLIQTYERTGKMRHNLYGDQLRVADFVVCGADKVVEHADIAVGASQTVIARIYVPFYKVHEFEPDEYSEPADEFKMMQLTMPSAADCSLNTSVVSAIAGNYFAVADIYGEHSVQAKLKDEMTFVGWNSQTTCLIPTVGKIRDLLIHQRGGTGGGSLANMSQLRIDELGMPPINRTPELLDVYTFRRGAAPGLSTTQGAEIRSDPFRAGRAAALILAGREESNTHGAIVEQVTVTADGSTVSQTGLNCIVRQVLPQSDAYIAQLSARFKLKPGQWRVKTRDKSKRDPRSWKPSQLRFLQKSAPLKSYRAA